MLLTFCKTGIQQVYAVPAIPYDNECCDNQQDDGREQKDGYPVLSALLLLFVVLRLQVNDAGHVVLFVQVLIHLVEPETVFRSIHLVAKVIQTFYQESVRRYRHIRIEGVGELVPLLNRCRRITFLHIDVCQQFLTPVGRCRLHRLHQAFFRLLRVAFFQQIAGAVDQIRRTNLTVCFLIVWFGLVYIVFQAVQLSQPVIGHRNVVERLHHP